jgi:hypothetical protein
MLSYAYFILHKISENLREGLEEVILANFKAKSKPFVLRDLANPNTIAGNTAGFRTQHLLDVIYNS